MQKYCVRFGSGAGAGDRPGDHNVADMASPRVNRAPKIKSDAIPQFSACKHATPLNFVRYVARSKGAPASPVARYSSANPARPFGPSAGLRTQDRRPNPAAR